jgi:hypothetical protein
LGWRDGRRLADEDEERGLEGVFRVLVVRQEPPADPPDQRPVPVHDRRERVGILGSDEALQQARVGRVVARRTGQGNAEPSKQPIRSRAGHRANLAGSHFPHYQVSPPTSD